MSVNMPGQSYNLQSREFLTPPSHLIQWILESGMCAGTCVPPHSQMEEAVEYLQFEISVQKSREVILILG
jgi:hypothetical protein